MIHVFKINGENDGIRWQLTERNGTAPDGTYTDPEAQHGTIRNGIKRNAT